MKWDWGRPRWNGMSAFDDWRCNKENSRWHSVLIQFCLTRFILLVIAKHIPRSCRSKVSMNDHLTWILSFIWPSSCGSSEFESWTYLKTARVEWLAEMNICWNFAFIQIFIREQFDIEALQHPSHDCGDYNHIDNIEYMLLWWCAISPLRGDGRLHQKEISGARFPSYKFTESPIQQRTGCSDVVTRWDSCPPHWTMTTLNCELNFAPLQQVLNSLLIWSSIMSVQQLSTGWQKRIRREFRDMLFRDEFSEICTLYAYTGIRSRKLCLRRCSCHSNSDSSQFKEPVIFP